MKKENLRLTSVMLLLILILNLILPGSLGFSGQAAGAVYAASFVDIAGHWAEREIEAWTARNLSGGYPDGTFQPDRPIARVEFFAWLNRVFGYPAVENNVTQRFTDVMGTEWYAGDIEKAVAAGYLGGYPDGTVKALEPLTRQEAAALLLKILPPPVFNLSMTGGNTQDLQFTDAEQIPAWSKPAIQAAIGGGYMGGYPDGIFRPDGFFTRAEAIAVLNRAAGTTYSQAGTYGPVQGRAVINGNVTISSSDIVLQNITINGNLYLTEGIGSGKIDLKNVTVQGSVKISGGGNEGGICISDSTLGVVLAKGSVPHPVGIRAEGDTSVAVLNIQSPVCIEERDSTSGFSKLLIELAEHTQTQAVVLKGSFDDVTVKSPAQVELQRGNIRMLNLEATAQGSKIQLAYGTNIQVLSVEVDDTLIHGEGTIGERQILGKNVTVDLKTGSGKKAKSANNVLSDIQVNGVTIDGFAPDTFSYSVSLPAGMGTIPTVTATAQHAKATVEVVQAEALPGTAVITVTAENGRKQNYVVHFSIGGLSPTKKITSFRFAGLDPAVDGVINEGAKTITVTVPYGTDVTSLVPTITHTGASITPSSGTSQDFTNPVVYTVTAEDGTTAQYTVTVTIAPNTDASLTSLTVSAGTLNFVPGTEDYEVTVPHDTTEVTVTFTAAPEATTSVESPQTVVIAGGTGYFEVEVTAGDGVTKKTYTIKFTEAPDNDATLSDLRVDGETISGFTPNTYDYSVVVPYGTAVVPTVSATTTDPNANADITQATAFTGPDNVATVVVTAENGTTTKEYTVTFTMAPPSTDATLSDLCVNNMTVPGFASDKFEYTIDVPYGTTVGSALVNVTATKNDPNATMDIRQATELPGAATVVVTAEDGVTENTYTVNFNVLPNTDASLTSLTVSAGTLNFVPGTEDYEVTVPHDTTEVTVTFTAAPEATTSVESPQTVVIAGGTGYFEVEVTAGDGVTTKTYTINFTEAPDNDATLSDLRVDGETISGFTPNTYDYSVVVPYGTAVVPTVSATTTDPNANADITQATAFTGPDNVATVVVTAENGTTTKEYTVTFTMAPPSTDATLSDLRVNNETVPGFASDKFDYTIDVPYGTTVGSALVNVSATKNDPNATMDIRQVTELPGAATVVVTAEDGVTENTYTVNFNVLPNTDASLTSLTVSAGTLNFVPGTEDYEVTVPHDTTEVTVTFTAAPEATTSVESPQTVVIAGGTGCFEVEVTAGDGVTTKTYTINFTEAPDNDATLSDLRVDGETISGFTPNTYDYSVVVPYGTAVVPTVSATTTDPNANADITQATAFTGPDNVATVVVTAENGITTKEYTVTFTMAPPSTDATLSDLCVNNMTVPDFASDKFEYTIDVPYGTTVGSALVNVTATKNDPNATMDIRQATELPGAATVVVTAEDGVTENTYTVNFNVLPNTDASLTSLTVSAGTLNFVPGTEDYEVTVPHDTTEVTVTFTAAPEATTSVESPQTVVIAGGTGYFEVEVTAGDGVTKKTYTIKFTEAPDNDATLSDLRVDGETISGFTPNTYDYSVVVPYGTAVVPTVSATTTDPNANADITQATAFTGPDNVATVVVTAENGTTTKEYTVTFTMAPPSTDATLSDLCVNNMTVPGFASDKFEYTIDVPYGTTVGSALVNVTATKNDPNATMDIRQATELPGAATVVVTAEDGVTENTYTVNFNVLPNTDASLTSLTVSAGTLNFVPGTEDYEVTVPHDTTEVTVTFTAAPEATTSVESPQTVVIAGGTGYFEVEVTAGDGVTTKTYTINFTEAPDNDATLSDLRVDGETISGFTPNTYDYSVVVPYGTAVVPTVSATTTDPNANADITQATAFTGPDNVATVVVTAENGTTTKEYTVTFTMAPPSTDATLSDLCVNNMTVPDFASDKFEYTIDVPYGTTVGSALVNVTATKNDPNATMDIRQATELPGAATVVVTAEDGVTENTYTVNFNVLPNTDASLTSLTVSAGTLNFVPGTEDYEVTVPHDTTEVTVTFTAAPEATTSVESPQTVVIAGGTGYFEVEVTAGDGVTTKTYTINFTEAPDNDATLSDLRVDGETISGFTPNTYDYSVVVPYGTAVVPTVSATTTDPNANADITQATAFTGPDNVATVVVTAENGTTTKEYTVTFTMAPPSTDATLSDLCVNNMTVPDFASDKFEYTIDVPYGTTVGSALVNVTATKNDPNATMDIRQATELPGAATVVVTAEDGVTENTYTVNFNVLPNTDASLTSLTVSAGTLNFVPGTEDYEVTVPHDTTEVTVTFTAAPEATTSVESPQTVVIAGGTGYFEVEVTAGDGVTKKTYTIKFTEAPDNDATLSDLRVDGETISGFTPNTYDYSVVVPYGTAVVPTVSATTTDPNANADITQATAFTGPDNVATVVVTAENGTTTKEYTVTFTMAPPSTDATLSDLCVNNMTVPDFASDKFEYTIDVPYGTTVGSALVNVSATKNDPNATMDIRQATELPGAATVVVTAEDGVTENTYTVNFNVLPNTDASLTSLTVSAGTLNFVPGTEDYEVTVPHDTTEVTVTFTAAPEATTSVESPQTVVIAGGTGYFEVEVTAGDGVTTKTYTINFTEAPDNDATLSDLRVDGETISGFTPNTYDYSVVVPYGTAVVPTVSATTTDPNANADITQATAFTGPDNVATVVVTAENGTTTKEYTVTFTMAPPSTDATLSDLRVNNETVPGFASDKFDYTIDVPYGTTVGSALVNVSATKNDPNATMDIRQVTELPGAATVVVTAEDGVTENTYTVNFNVLPNTDASLTSLTVSAGTLNFVPGTEDYEVTVPHDTTEVTVTFTAAPEATTSVESPQTVVIAGGTGYFEVEVTAGDGVTTKTYTINFTEAPDNDATLSDLRVDGETISGFTPNTYDYGVVVPYGTAVVPTVSATTTDPNANADITQATAFTGPDNVATVVVTAENGTTTKEYTVTFTMAPPSTDATLSDLCVNNMTVPDFASDKFEYTIDVPYGTTVGSALVNVSATKNDPNATMDIRQATELPGAATVVVTAEDGVTENTYTVNFNVLPNTDASLTSLTVSAGTLNFVPGTEDYEVTVPHDTTEVTVTFTAAPEATTSVESPQTVVIAGGTGYFEVEVTAGDGVNTKTYTINFTEAPDNDATLSDLKVDGETISGFAPHVYDYSYVVPYGTATVPTVSATTTDPNANAETTQATSFTAPDNVATVLVTAEDGSTTKTYTVTFTMALPSTDATLSDLRVNNVTVPGFAADKFEYTIDVPYGTPVGSDLVQVTAEKNDPNATMNINQATALPGEATVVVTAEDGIASNTYTVNFNVLPNTDASLTSLTVSAGELNFAPGTLNYDVTVPHDTASVTVTFTAAPQADTSVESPQTVMISGGTGYFEVTVTAGDKVNTKTYTINFTEAPDNDATLSDLKVDGETISGFAPHITSYSLELPYGTATVPTVSATTTDPNANAETTQATSFTDPDNVATVVVTAEDGSTTKTYTVTFTMAPPSTDATLSDLRVNNVTVPGFAADKFEYTIDVPYGTPVGSDLVQVTAEKNDPKATMNINQATALPGEATVVVTAEDGIASNTYTVNFNVLPNTDASLTSLTVSAGELNFAPGTLNYNVTVPHDTASVTVTFTAAPQADTSVESPQTVTIAGGTGYFEVTVTAGDKVNTKTYTINFTEAPDNDATLSDLKVDGVTISGFAPNVYDYSYVVPYGTATVPTVSATTTDPNANAETTQATSFTDPDNVATVLVTAEDGTTTKTYTVTFTMALPSTDATLSDLRVNNVTVPGFAADKYEYTIDVPYGTTVGSALVNVTATKNDPNATMDIRQATELPGAATVVVTAEDGVTENTYTVNFNVLPNTDASLTSLTVSAGTLNFVPGTEDYEVTVPHDTTEVTVTFTAAPEATTSVESPQTVVIAGGTGYFEVEVTAGDGVTTKTYTINFTEAPDNDATLSDLRVDGETISGFTPNTYDYSVVVPYGTAVVPTVSATTTDPNANADITQATSFTEPDNVATVVVTAEDGITTKEYTVTFTMAVPSTDATLSDLCVNNETVPGFASDKFDYTIDVPYGTTVGSALVNVSATKNDPNATMDIRQATELPGAATVVVTAEDGVTENTYTVNFNVLPNTDASLTSLTVSAGTLNFVPGTEDYEVTVPHDTTEVTVTFTAAPEATTSVESPQTVVIAGGTGCFEVEVTAGDGVTKKTYTIKFTEAPDNDATLSDLRVDGETISGFTPNTYDYSVVVPYGTAVVPTVSATTTDPNANADITQATAFTGPDNVATVVVTAENGTTTKEYTVTFTMAPPSTDATLSDLCVNNMTVPDFASDKFEYTIDVPYGTTVGSALVNVSATKNDPNATMDIRQATELPGAATVVVTAEDGVTENTYTVNFNVLPNTDASLTSLTVSAGTLNFVPGTEDYEVTVPHDTTEVTVTFTAAPEATTSVESPQTVVIAGGTGCFEVEVTAGDGVTTKTYTINFIEAFNTAKEITDFRFEGFAPGEVECIIDEENREITVFVPYGTELDRLVPIIEVSEGASVSPGAGEPQDFTNPVIYTVTGTGVSSVEYTVTVVYPRISVGAGFSHSLALDKYGTVWAWGSNEFGQLGNGTQEDSYVPVEVSDLTGIIAISAGYAHNMALKADGTVYAWGLNQFGQLGIGSTENKSTPERIEGLPKIIAISAGANHSLALDEDGTVYAWGWNQFGQLGIGSTENKSTPEQIEGLPKIIAISAGAGHSLALAENGTVYEWGADITGDLLGTPELKSSVPEEVENLQEIIAISAGDLHNMALDKDGNVWTWGNNESGQLGQNRESSDTPGEVSELNNNIIVISAGSSHSLALDANGNVWAWGNGSATPNEVNISTEIIAIAAGVFHNLALDEEGNIWGWGSNKDGQLGTAGTIGQSIDEPVKVCSLAS